MFSFTLRTLKPTVWIMNLGQHLYPYKAYGDLGEWQAVDSYHQIVYYYELDFTELYFWVVEWSENATAAAERSESKSKATNVTANERHSTGALNNSIYMNIFTVNWATFDIPTYPALLGGYIVSSYLCLFSFQTDILIWDNFI